MGNIFMHLNGFSSIFVRAQTLHIVRILLWHKLPGRGPPNFKEKNWTLFVHPRNSMKLDYTPLNSPPVFLSPISSWMKKLNFQAYPLPLLSPHALT
jgi:hypothetical protein